MTELDSALNQWVDSLPPHRACFQLMSILGPLHHTCLGNQFAGIQIAPTSYSSRSPQRSSPTTIKFRSPYIGRSSLRIRRADKRLSRLLSSVPMLPVRASRLHTWCTAEEAMCTGRTWQVILITIRTSLVLIGAPREWFSCLGSCSC